jgi:hypothetical protein
VALFFPSIGPAAPFEIRQQKRGLQLQKSGVMRKENSGEKKERNQASAVEEVSLMISESAATLFSLSILVSTSIFGPTNPGVTS